MLEFKEKETKNDLSKIAKPLISLGVPGGIRTPDLEVRSLAFYPAKLQAHNEILFLNISYLTIIIHIFKNVNHFLKYNYPPV